MTTAEATEHRHSLALKGFGPSFPFVAFQVEVKSLFLLDTGKKTKTQTGSNSRLNLGWKAGIFGLRRCSQNTVPPSSKATQRHHSALGKMVAF